MHNSSSHCGHADLLLTATLFLMTQYMLQRRAVIADAVVDHLEKLKLLDNEVPPRLSVALPRLRDQWQLLASGREATVRSECVVIPFRAAEPRR